MSTVAEKIKEVTSLYDKGNWGNALVLLRKITGAAPQERWKITNFIAWINWKQGLKINARNLWETIVYEEDCNKQILTSAHVGLSTHYANSNEREEALKHAIRLKPDYIAAYNHLVQLISQKKGETPQYVRVYEKHKF